MTAPDPHALSALADRMEIERLLVRYCTAIDTRRFAGLDEVFTADAVIDYTSAGGIRGSLEEIKTWLAKALVPFVVVQHLVTNFDVRVEGDRAESICSLFNPMGLGDGAGGVSMFWCGGRYRDELVRTRSGWRIRSRTNEMLYMHGAPPGIGKRSD